MRGEAGSVQAVDASLDEGRGMRRGERQEEMVGE